MMSSREKEEAAIEAEWDRLFRTRKSERWFSRQSAEIRAAIEKGDTTDFDPDNLPDQASTVTPTPRSIPG